jgi:hypothetical protein
VEGAITEGGYAPSGGQRLRPLGIGETLDWAIKLYRNNAVTLWKIVSVIIVPLQIIDVIVRRVSLPSDVFLQDGTLYTRTGQSTGDVIALLLVTLLVLIGSLVATGATLRALVDAYLGHPTDWRTSLEHARTRAGSLIWLAVLTAVLTIIGFFLLFVPGLWFIVAVSVAVPVLMVEGASGFAAMKRSINLVDTRWWATFWRLLAAYLLLGVAIFGLSALVSAVGNGITNVTLFLVLGGAINAVVSILLSPFVAAVITVIYVDLRVRKEALDIELLAGSFDASGQPPTE